MSLRAKIDQCRSHTWLGVWKRTSSPKDPRTVQDNITQYLDETTKPVGAEGMRLHGGLQNPLPDSSKPREGIDYLAKEEKGRIRVIGFLADDITNLTGKYPIHLTNKERVQAAAEAWQQRSQGKRLRSAAHKYVLSLHPDLCEVLNEMGKPVDEVIVNAARRVLRKYQEKYYPGERLGAIIGLHHDRKHIHGHIMLYPTTERGKLLRVTDEGPGRRGWTPFTDMRLMTQKVIQDYFEREIMYPAKASDRRVNEVMQGRLLARAALVSWTQQGQPGGEAEKWFWVAQEKKRLEHLSPEQLRPHLRSIYEAECTRLTQLTKVAAKSPEAKDKLLANLKTSDEAAKKDLHAAFTRLKELNAARRDLTTRRREGTADLTTWKSIRLRTLRNLEGCLSPADP